jgi:hypothetical protein
MPKVEKSLSVQNKRKRLSNPSTVPLASMDYASIFDYNTGNTHYLEI